MNDQSISVPNYNVLVNGSELSEDLRGAIEGITLEDEIDLPAMFTIRLNAVNQKTNSWRGVDLKAFKPGDPVKVSMGIDQTVAMITGEITALEAVFDRFSYLEIRGFDRLHRLRFGTKRRSFQNVKDSDLASTIASEAGLSAQVDATPTVHPYVFQNNQSNYDFLLERARRNGYEMLVNDKTFYFRKSQEDKSPEVTLNYGLELESFKVQLKTLTTGSVVEFRGWDVKTKKEISGKAKSGSEKTTMEGQKSGYKLSEPFGGSATAIVDGAILDASEAENLAKASYNNTLIEFITAEGMCGGNQKIRAGSTVKIDGVDRFGGTYYIVSSVHSIRNNQSYLTTFKAKRTGI
jgi:uncharacterized protein